MFKRLDVNLLSNPVCTQAVQELHVEDFLYYDKDGFELNIAERKFYKQNGFPLNSCLNHICWQEPWFQCEQPGLILDHSLILHRASYADFALEQLSQHSRIDPRVSLLIQTKQKWGFDFALDAVDTDNNVYEVLHVEYDSNNYDEFINTMLLFEYKVRYMDWIDAAQRIDQQRTNWQHLSGFKSNDWKAKYLIDWNQAEYTLKSSYRP